MMNIHPILILLTFLPVIKSDELKEAKVTTIIQDVRVLPANAPVRPASISDIVHGDTAVTTGFASRTELTFQDATVTRIGSRSIFTFKEGTRTIELKSGSVLLSVPKGAPKATIKASGLTASTPGIH